MEDGSSFAPVTVFRGSRGSCAELCLVFEARGVPYEMVEDGNDWFVSVAPALVERANDEMSRYASERRSFALRQRERQGIAWRKPFGGALAGAVGYGLTLFLVAYAAGDSTFGLDWVGAGALEVPAPGHGIDWWRALTSLTLHRTPDHLFSNLAFGVAGGVLCTRLFGYGIGWLGILAAGCLANLVEMWMGPTGHAAIGASTAVFGSVGLLSGYSWRQRLTLRERWLYRWTPLIGGVTLLALLGAGGDHVDVLGHLLGFLAGVVMGWLYALAGLPRNRRAAPQNLAALTAVLMVFAGWTAALWAAAS